jgi:hypothetical protein
MFTHSSRCISPDQCLNAGILERALGQLRLSAATVRLEDDEIGVLHLEHYTLGWVERSVRHLSVRIIRAVLVLTPVITAQMDSTPNNRMQAKYPNQNSNRNSHHSDRYNKNDCEEHPISTGVVSRLLPLPHQ